VNNLESHPAFNLLLQSVRIDDEEDTLKSAEEIITGNEINWDDLYSEAELHSVKPQLAKLISSLDTTLVPEEFRVRLNLAHQANLYLQMSYASEFIRLNKILNESGILVVPFKGFWLAGEFYSNLADRESIDIDLFIRENDLERIAFIMINEGYQPQPDFLPYSIDRIKKSFHEYNFDRFEGDVRLFHVEFHWRMSTEVYGMDIRLEDLSSEIVKGKLQGHEIDVFTPSANLLLTVMHHGGKDLFRELKQVLDIAMILKNNNRINWKLLLDEADRFNIRNLVLVAVLLASEISGAEIPAGIIEITRSEKIIKLTESRMRFLAEMSEGKSGIRLGLNRWFFRMQSLTSLKVKLQVTWLILILIVLALLVPDKLRKYLPYSEFTNNTGL
jgi:hypothetical protein